MALSQFAWAHAHETLLWASKGKGAEHTFNYDLLNSHDPDTQVSSVWRIPAVQRREKLHGYHPTQKPARKDVVSCGDGRDRVLADRADVLAPDCERVVAVHGSPEDIELQEAEFNDSIQRFCRGIRFPGD